MTNKPSVISHFCGRNILFKRESPERVDQTAGPLRSGSTEGERAHRLNKETTQPPRTRQTNKTDPEMDTNAASILPSSCYRSFGGSTVPNPLDTCNRCQSLAYMNHFGNFAAQEQACHSQCNEWFKSACPAQGASAPPKHM